MRTRLPAGVWGHLAAVVVLLSACATATISRQVIVRPAIVSATAPGQLSDAVLIGGRGADWARTLICTSRESCMIFGQTIKSFGETTDFFAAREDNGTLTWARTYGGTHRDLLRVVSPAVDGETLLVGISSSLFFTPMKAVSPSRPPRPFLVRIDRDGAPRWAQTYEGQIAYVAEAVEMPDGGHVIAASEQGAPRDAVVAFALARDGRSTWGYRYELAQEAAAGGAARGSDQTLLIGGVLVRTDRRPVKVFAMAIDHAGAVARARTYEPSGAYYVHPVAAVADGFVLAGAVHQPGREVFVMKISLTGTPQWANAYALTSGEAIAVIPDSDGDVLVVGRVQTGPFGKYDGFGLLLGPGGGVRASIVLGGPGDDEIMSAARWGPKQYRLLGSTEQNGKGYFDILSVVWSPELRDSAEAKVRTTPIEMTASDANPQVSAVTLKPTNIPTSLLEMTTLEMPSTR